MRHRSLFYSLINKILLLILILIGTAACSSGGGDDDNGDTSGKSTTFSISGTVNGDIQSGVTITLSGGASATTTTDTSGNYSFSGLANGSYTVTPLLTNYTFSPADIAVTLNGANSSGNNFTASAVPVTYGISGQVTGDVQQGVTITLSGDASATTTTDVSGNYSFTGLANGAYTLTPSLVNYTFSPVDLSVTLNGGDSTDNNFTASVVPVTYSISGQISGDVQQGVTITLSGDAFETTTTDVSGNYSFTGLANGSYMVTPSLANYTFSPIESIVTINNQDSSGNNFNSTADTLIGQFLDGPIEGLAYSTNTGGFGVTDTSGQFQYTIGSTVTFSIGGVTLGSATGKDFITPVDLVSGGDATNPTVLNIVRFLILISEINIDNSRTISPEVQAAAASWSAVDFTSATFETDIAAIISSVQAINSSAALPSVAVAQQHLTKTLQCAFGGGYSGTWTDNTVTGNWQLIVDPLDGSVFGGTWDNANPPTSIIDVFNGILNTSVTNNFSAVGIINNPATTYSGTLLPDGSLDGTWSNTANNGTFSGSRMVLSLPPNTPGKVYHGVSKGNNGDASVFIFAIDGTTLTGSGINFGTGTTYTVSGTVSGSTITGTATNNSTNVVSDINGTLFSDGSIRGVYQDQAPDTGSGTFNACADMLVGDSNGTSSPNLSPSGGSVGGGSIAAGGTLTVDVSDLNSGSALLGATVIVDHPADGRQVGTSAGPITFTIPSGGPVTVTAAKSGYGILTFVNIDASIINLALSPLNLSAYVDGSVTNSVGDPTGGLLIPIEAGALGNWWQSCPTPTLCQNLNEGTPGYYKLGIEGPNRLYAISIFEQDLSGGPINFAAATDIGPLVNGQTLTVDVSFPSIAPATTLTSGTITVPASLGTITEISAVGAKNLGDQGELIVGGSAPYNISPYTYTAITFASAFGNTEDMFGTAKGTGGETISLNRGIGFGGGGVDFTLIDVPTNASPSGDCGSLAPTLSWTAVTGASFYHLPLQGMASDWEILVDGNTTTVTLPDLTGTNIETLGLASGVTVNWEVSALVVPDFNFNSLDYNTVTRTFTDISTSPEMTCTTP